MLDLGVSNLERWAGYSDNGLEITAYLKQDISRASGQRVNAQISEWPGVAKSRYISKEDALQTLKDETSLQQALDALDNNPLPASIVITLPHDTSIRSLAQGLVEQARSLPEVDWVLFDLDWFNKAEALLRTGQTINQTLSAFLSIGVCLVIGNCVRQTIDHKRDEILVSKLVGATDSFVRRPFLMMGMWVGTIGAILGLALSTFAWSMLDGNLGDIGLAYGSDVTLAGVEPLKALGIATSCALFGLIGAWAICNRQLRQIDPE